MSLDPASVASAAPATPPPEPGGSGAAEAASPDIGKIAARPSSASAYAEVCAAMQEAEELVAQAVQGTAATLHRR